MTEQIPLIETQAQLIRARLRRAIDEAERVQADLEPAPSVRTLITGEPHLAAFAAGIGVFSGLVLSWVFGWLEFSELLSSWGLSQRISENLPTFLILWLAAGAAAVPVMNESRESRHRLLTEGQNAHARAAVLYAVIEQLGEILPGAIPNVSEYAHDGRDADPNPLVERAIGNMGPPLARHSSD